WNGDLVARIYAVSLQSAEVPIRAIIIAARARKNGACGKDITPDRDSATRLEMTDFAISHTSPERLWILAQMRIRTEGLLSSLLINSRVFLWFGKRSIGLALASPCGIKESSY